VRYRRLRGKGRLTSVEADAAIAAVIGGTTRTTALVIEGSTSQPPRRLTKSLGRTSIKAMSYVVIVPSLTMNKSG